MPATDRRPVRVVVVGDLMVDVVATAQEPLADASDAAARVRWTGGGAGANVAAGLAAAGVAVALVARVGDDLPGRAATAALRDAGVDVWAAVDAERPTGTCVVVVAPDGERSMLPDRGANAALAPGDLPPALLRAGAHLHLSGYVLLHAGGRSAGRAALAAATAAGMTVSVDPASAAPLRALGAATFLAWVRGVDLLLPNAQEAAVLTGERDPARAARALAARAQAREVVVTLGADGALHCDGATVLHAPAPPATVVDTTGAGDAFTAGWLAARVRGAVPAEALRAACAAGAAAVARDGARGL
jgi:sugar/nucleoside kinase (ribokinase family)